MGGQAAPLMDHSYPILTALEMRLIGVINSSGHSCSGRICWSRKTRGQSRVEAVVAELRHKVGSRLGTWHTTSTQVRHLKSTTFNQNEDAGN